MKNTEQIRISQCMIVKNEEKNIERALLWGKNVVSEQIVVDTGSTDQTVEIAKRMGAEVYHFLWADDFSAAKNFALDKAQYEWIAFLDADEYFTEEDADKILPLLNQIQHQPYDGVATGLINLDDDGNAASMDVQLRIFRNHPKLRYRRRVHEHLAWSSGRKLTYWIGNEQLSIYHTGYSEEASKKKRRGDRNVNLILAELQDRPDDFEMLAYLGNEYVVLGKHDLAEETYKRAISLLPDSTYGVYHLASSELPLRLLDLLSQRQDIKEAELLDLYQYAAEHWPEEGDYDYLMGNYYVRHGNYAKAEVYIRHGLETIEKYGNYQKSALISGKIMKVYELLAVCCFNNGNLADAVKVTTAILKENPYLMGSLIVFVSAFCRDMTNNGKGMEGAIQVAALMERSFYDFSSLKDRLFVLKAAESAGYHELAEVIRGLCSAEELRQIDKTSGDNRQSKAESAVNHLQADNSQIENVQKYRIVLFYSGTESFNFFTDQLVNELQKRNHDIFVLDLMEPQKDGPHSAAALSLFAAQGVDAVICFDGFGCREDLFIRNWDGLQATVLNILMDPPFRFHPSIEKHPKKYHLFCCDYEHVAYVKKYFPEMAPFVSFMPHVGMIPSEESPIIPYARRKYDILFSGTYYSPQSKLMDTKQLLGGDESKYHFYEVMYDNLIKDTSLTIEQAVLKTLKQMNLSVSETELKTIFNYSVHLDWAIRMYERERVVSVLAEAGLELYLLGRGWENHPAASYPNVHRIDDRIPYAETLMYMANAKINLNVMPWFKEGTHDRIFNTLLQHSLPLTDSSTWIDEHFTDGVDIALYDLDHLEQLPDIARGLLEDTSRAEAIIEKGYEKVLRNYTWSHCVDWILEVIQEGKLS